MPYSRSGNDDERNYQHAVKTLSVILNGSYAGEITVFRGGYASFQYDTTYSGPSLSVRMPVGSGPFYTDVLVPWIEGLLPDSPRVRQSMAREASCSATNPFELLEYFGRDCPDAVQICSPLDVASVLAQEGDYEPVSDAIIGSKLT